MIALGVYQSLVAARSVADALKSEGYHYSLIHRDQAGAISVEPPKFLWFSKGLHKSLTKNFLPLVCKGETFVIVEARAKEALHVIDLLTQVAAGESITFLFRRRVSVENGEKVLLHAALPSHEFQQEAIRFAKNLRQKPLIFSKDSHLLTRLMETKSILSRIHQELIDADKLGQATMLSVNWILDNYYLIRGHIEDVLRNLPKQYYHELPKIVSEKGDVLPRAYLVGLDLIRNTDGKLTQDNMVSFLKAYQTIAPLTIGELWALPLLLRVGLLESLRTLVLKVNERQLEGEEARLWGNRLLVAQHKHPEDVSELIRQLERSKIVLSAHFAQELLDHLFDEDQVLVPVRDWFEKVFKKGIVEVLQQEQLLETSEQISIANCIKSLMVLSQIDWRSVFKQVSIVDEVLLKDPSGTFKDMDLRTTDLYRRPIERIARGAKVSEVEVAEAALSLAERGKDSLGKNVGYYLIDQGLPELEQQFDYRLSFSQKIQRWTLKHPCAVYLGTIAFFAMALQSVLIWYLASTSLSFFMRALFAFFAFIPLLELVVQLVNFAITWALPPFTLPKLHYKQGVPKDRRTLIVIPMLLVKESLPEQLFNLETHYLANSDPELRYALFADFVDHPELASEQDEELLNSAKEGIVKLNDQYGDGRFFLFHRPRVWSESEQAFIGRERKRGKLEELNTFLLKRDSSILYAGTVNGLEDIRYVITLDADTQLQKDRAIRLIETISHPLNEAVLAPDGTKVLRGYTIIQPRVTTSLPSANQTYFSRIFSGAIGSDPYTQSVSDVYQDLVHQGSYHGKGIYDLKVFSALLDRRFPEEHILSHDLIEGAYVRTGYASGIELFDEFPGKFEAYGKRERRWIRGDWQIIDWLFPFVPKADGYEKNPLDCISRWKIFHNLIRSLFPISLLFLLLTAVVKAERPFLWTAFAWFIILLPTLVLSFFRMFKPQQELVLASNQLQNSFYKALINAALIPYQAYISLDAIIRVLYRRVISKRYLLEWNGKNQAALLPSLVNYALPVASGTLFLFLGIQEKWTLLFSAGTFLALWTASPWLIGILNRPISSAEELAPLSKTDRHMLRQIARRTWRYFDDFVTEEGQWLPPDNFQERLNREVAYRTSPTNIGFYLLSIVSAYDLGFISADEVVEKVGKTLKTLEKLERYEGHFLNWYEIKELQPLLPKYVSTVDSGNLLACLWTLSVALEEIASNTLLSENSLEGLRDTFEEFDKVYHGTDKAINQQIGEIHKLLKAPPNILDCAFRKKIASEAERLHSALKSDDPDERYWAAKFLAHAKSFENIVDRYLSWKPTAAAVSYRSLAEGQATGPEYEKARWLAGEKLGEINRMQALLKRFSDEMNMAFLYNNQRKLFSIGYNATDCTLDNSYYDLLASEARLSSLVAIAKNEAPVDHWWSLGRPYAVAESFKVLLSWGGTMFEYLMPILLTKNYEKSLLDSACNSAVNCQIAYGERRGIPWGISESAFSGLDSRGTYQYRSFGVPKLGLKRGLEEDLVISPYSTAMSLQINPKEAFKNMHFLMNQMHHSMLGDYGFYESIDYTREYGPHGQRGVAVYAYMAHHQGMSLLAFNNCLNDNVMQRRFHDDPRISAVESLLYERLPTSVPLTREFARQSPVRRLRPFTAEPVTERASKVDTPYPQVNLLSNGKYAVMTTNAGSGYSLYGSVSVTRWRADPVSEELGAFIYIKDLELGAYWSATYQPTCAKPESYQVRFTPDKSTFTRRDKGIETKLDVVVSPEDNVEIRRLTFANLSQRQRHLEITSYSELALAPHNADRAHPLFNKMFIQTEVSAAPSGLIAYRRLRSAVEEPLYAGQIISALDSDEVVLQFETDRKKFIGRGRTLENPEALDRNLSNSEGCVLDPIFSLRKQLILAPGQRVELAFVTMMGESQEAVLALMDKYKDLQFTSRAIDMAWTQAQLQLRYLRIKQEEAQYFQKLASRLIYPQLQTRPSPERIKRNKLSQSQLWGYGISGDLPLLSVTIGNANDLDVVKELLTAHSFLNLRGLQFDLVLLNEEATAYDQPLNDQIFRLMQSHENYYRGAYNGRIYLLNMDQIPEQDLNLIISTSRVFLVAARGMLRQQLMSQAHATKYPPYLQVKQGIEDSLSPNLPFLELAYFNGLGGFTLDGKEYVIYLGPNQSTPAPWINVIANPNFGTLVSETGLGTTWFGNSQSNRLTPWSNDNVLNPIQDAIYIRDNDLGTYWTPTPGPIRELDAYRIRHGQGYSTFEHNSHGIEQHLSVFVPVDEHGGAPVRIQRLVLKNLSSRKRSLTLMAYSELTMGENRETSMYHTVAEWDYESQSIFARNYYKQDFSGRVAFAASSPSSKFHTTDRKEFIGRNHTARDPLALARQNLSNTTEIALDPCAALQVDLELEPNETKEIIFLLGQAQDSDEARRIVRKFRDSESVEKALQASKKWWQDHLQTIEVETPLLSVNFLINNWLLYQNLSCRIWGRTAFYQSSGAFGFRDQLQDAMATLYAWPAISREQILRAAAHQFVEGDVQHWWHPITDAGIRTRITDDLLWLPFVVAQYIRVTKDTEILHERIPFLDGPLLEERQDELYFVPTVTQEKETLLEHCRRAIRKGSTSGPHGLPLIGTGDWNDGLNRVGVEGKGESVWLAWFLSHVLHDFSELLKWAGDPEDPAPHLQKAHELKETIEAEAWDGEWYLRAFFDDGTPLGSHKGEEAKIDSLSQSWSVISKGTRKDRSEKGLAAVKKHLLDKENRLLRLLTPPFNHIKHDPGYIKGYPPGIRENGAQYTHGSLWVPLAFSRLGKGEEAIEILQIMNPIERVKDEALAWKYKVEPYAIAADVYTNPLHEGMGGWTWYTGSAGWMYRVWVEEILGFKLRGDVLTIQPTAPWPFKVRYRYKETLYQFDVSGKLDKPFEITLINDLQEHQINV